MIQYLVIRKPKHDNMHTLLKVVEAGSKAAAIRKAMLDERMQDGTAPSLRRMPDYNKAEAVAIGSIDFLYI